MSDPPRDPKSRQSRGDLKISLTPAGLFVVAMIVFFFAGGIFAYVQLLTRSLQSNQGQPANTQKSPATGFFSKESAVSATSFISPASPTPTATSKPTESPATPTPTKLWRRPLLPPLPS